MIKTVANFIDEYKLSNKTIVVGFSGGYDSSCLLDILLKLREDKNIRIIAAHLNHNWRAEKSLSEQKYCEKYCKINNVEFYTESLPDNVKKTETVARELRYKFFENTLKKYNADVVFTAHNFDDNAETILYRIFKGTGIVGLTGIKKYRGIYYRPLLSVSRTDIEKYCKDNRLTPNNDNSNKDIKYKRNLIRCDIIPQLKSINPEIVKTLNNLSLVSQSECNIIDEYISKISSDVFDDGKKILTKKYKLLSNDVKKHILYNLIYESEVDYDYSKVIDMYNFIEAAISLGYPTKMSITTNKWLYVDSSVIELFDFYDKVEEIIEVNKCGIYNLGDTEFQIEKADKRENVKDESTAYVNLENYKSLFLRTRRNGDVITPLGCSGSVKLKKYLIDKKIAQHKRDKLILLCSDKEVLWVAGVGLSDKIKVSDNITHKLSIKYKDGKGYDYNR